MRVTVSFAEVFLFFSVIYSFFQILLVSIFCCVLSDVSGARQFVPSTEGRYVHDNSGRYSGDDGRYHPDSSGQYQGGDDGRYTHDYKQGKDVFGPDGGNGGRYVHQGDQFGAGVGVGGNSGANIGSTFVGQPISSVSSLKFTPEIKIIKKIKTVHQLIEQDPDTYKSQGLVTDVPLKSYEVRPNYGSSASARHDYNYGIIRQEGHNEEDGYHYLYETENGITGEEQGKLGYQGTENEAMQARGSYSYTGPDNVVYTVQYTADENGFVPSGSHIPTPPPIPEAILRSLEYQRSLGVL